MSTSSCLVICLVGTVFGGWSADDNLRGVLTRGEASRSSSNSNSSLGLKSWMIDIERSLCAGLVMITEGGVAVAVAAARPPLLAPPEPPPDAPPLDAPLAVRVGSGGAAEEEVLRVLPLVLVAMLDNGFDSAWASATASMSSLELLLSYGAFAFAFVFAFAFAFDGFVSPRYPVGLFLREMLWVRDWGRDWGRKWGRDWGRDWDWVGD